ncbi:MAG: hypothetical protein MJZ16_13155, partial [Bacteroidales bacterium]|nr:hypothetical protein [Bacteroidales bacterium]
SSMKNASAGDTSLSDILKSSDIPSSFATATFQRNTEQLSRIVESLDNSTVMENLLRAQTFRLDELEPKDAVSSDSISKWLNDGYTSIGYKNSQNYWKDIYSIKYTKQSDSDPRGRSYEVTLTPNKIKFVDDDNTVASGLTFHLSPYKQVIALYKKYLADNKLSSGSLDAFYQSLVNYKYPSCRPAFYVDQREIKAIEQTAEFTTEGLVYKYTKGQRVVLEPNALCLPESMFNWHFNVNKSDILVQFPTEEDYMYVKGVPADNSLYKRVTFQFPGYKWMTPYGNTALTPSFPVDEANKSIINPYEKRPEYLYGLLKEAFTSAFASENDLTVDSALRNLLTKYSKEAAPTLLLLTMSFKEQNAPLLSPLLNDQSVLSNLPKDLKISFIASYFACFNLLGKTYSMWTSYLGKQGLINILSYNDTTAPWMQLMLLHAICNTSRWQRQFAPMMFFINSRIGETPSNLILQDMIVPVKGFNRNCVVKSNYDLERYNYYQKTATSELQLKLQLNTIKYYKAVGQPVNESKTVSYQAGLQEDESFERMKEVASMYYQQFYSDTKEGKKIREQYLDELMMSKYPILAYPFFPEPTYYYLKMISDKFIIPGLEEIPDNGIAMFMSNAAFEEAYLCGMNTEMGKELLWREYPTDQRGSYFRKFWDSESSVEAIHDDKFFDVEPVHLWKGRLGQNHKDSKSGLLIFALRGQLMRQYPTTKIYLNGAIPGDKPNTLSFSAEKIEPVMETFIREDILLVGFKISLLKALGNPDKNDYGYMLTFEQSLDDLEFCQGAVKPTNTSATTAY